MAQRVGGEIDAFCTRCKLTLAHTILAMVGEKVAKVKCNTCNAPHAYRSAPGKSNPAKPRAVRKKKEDKLLISFEAQLESKDLSKAKKYTPADTYGAGDVIDHPSFGLGIVNSVRLDKADVGFKAFAKTLVHGRGGSGSAKAPITFSHPSPSADRRNSDKQPAAEAEESL